MYHIKISDWTPRGGLKMAFFISPMGSDFYIVYISDCPAKFEMSGKTCFYASDGEAEWGEAKDACVKLGGKLASIHNKKKQTEMENYFANKGIKCDLNNTQTGTYNG